jgi:hypothetical protein
VETTNQSGPNENPSTKTNKDDREPSWLLTLRMINETVTSNIIAMKPHQPFIPEKYHKFTQLLDLRKAQTHTSLSQYLFHNQSGFMDGEKTYL